MLQNLTVWHQDQVRLDVKCSGQIYTQLGIPTVKNHLTDYKLLHF